MFLSLKILSETGRVSLSPISKDYNTKHGGPQALSFEADSKENEDRNEVVKLEERKKRLEKDLQRRKMPRPDPLSSIVHDSRHSTKPFQSALLSLFRARNRKGPGNVSYNRNPMFIDGPSGRAGYPSLRRLHNNNTNKHDQEHILI